MEVITGVLVSIFEVFAASWWFVLPIVLFFIVWDLWLIYVRGYFIKNIEWKIFEIIIPKEILKTPKSMEQIFTSLHAMYSHGINKRLKDIYWYGKTQFWVSFEIAGNSGGIRFYVRTPVDFVKLIESAIYGQYPNAEIVEVEDYINNLPSALPNQVYDLWGADLIFAKDNAYPIKTYFLFEDIEEERRLDPMASLTEAMSALKSDESIFIQLIIRPVDDAWKKKGEEIVNKLVGKKTPVKKGSLQTLMDHTALFIKNLFIAPIQIPSWELPEEKSAPASLSALTPGGHDVVKSIETKISKLGFETNIRFIYVDKRDTFSRANVAATMGFFKQFNTQNLNAFKPDLDTIASASKGFFKKWNTFKRKKNLYGSYLLRIIGKSAPILNTEELATIYHYPAGFVSAPQLHRIETKRGSPPLNLPIE